jgi:uncharacterized protein YigA (DUF484 family)
VREAVGIHTVFYGYSVFLLLTDMDNKLFEQKTGTTFLVKLGTVAQIFAKRCSKFKERKL